ncbi:MAG: hypothetical protein JXA30_14175 [Deltaproteobacteria bacterium]|nr:hypothetical protein [Deltaproteobacteria bacterium]
MSENNTSHNLTAAFLGLATIAQSGLRSQRTAARSGGACALIIHPPRFRGERLSHHSDCGHREWRRSEDITPLKPPGESEQSGNGRDGLRQFFDQTTWRVVANRKRVGWFGVLYELGNTVS